MIVSVIGLGLIGGSLALGLKQNGFATKIIGVDNNERHTKEALEIGIADEIRSLQEAVELSQVIVIAVPVDAACKLLPAILDRISEDTIVLDMGSTKADICEVVEGHANRSRFVATHPIAGTENTGPRAAFPTLFMSKVGIICDEGDSDQDAVHLAERLYKSLFMKVVYMPSKEHDLHIAYVSHLSHISSFTLGLTVLEVEKDEKTIFNMAGSGFASTVRLAKSSPAMWAPIFDQNAKNISMVLGEYIKNLQIFKELIDNQDQDKMFELMENANDIRRILEGIILNEHNLIKK
ncbi:prephenate dehydrogenase [Fulvivirgaceae bacterium BMA10]|uniref:Prephenate dehydrogenase n=1 Tax=Splendidivirga corallicola TaxID=3051826 RepID=A0ABT8KUI4_9BACT|nr:prephenate dehydrogenase [Fulvivirgaceae bacterium BMA10]